MTPLTLTQQTAIDAMRPFHPRTRQRVLTLLDWYEDDLPGLALSSEDRRVIVAATVGWLAGTAEYVRLADMPTTTHTDSRPGQFSRGFVASPIAPESINPPGPGQTTEATHHG